MHHAFQEAAEYSGTPQALSLILLIAPRQVWDRADRKNNMNMKRKRRNLRRKRNGNIGEQAGEEE